MPLPHDAWLACSVSRGQFPGEYAVAAVRHDGQGFSLFAPSSAVAPPTSGEGDGLLRVEVVTRKGDLVLVRLPAQSFEYGQHVTVAAAALHNAAAPQRIGA